MVSKLKKRLVLRQDNLGLKPLSLNASHHNLATISVLAVMGSMPHLAQAQEVGFDEIIVTATRRAVDIQDVGITMTALNAEALRSANVVDTDSLSQITPGLSIIKPGSPMAGIVAIRGVAQNDFAAHLESANIFYVDDVYRPSNGSIVQRLYDVERVEVLKGPQGTLFGRNATGGLVHIITASPNVDAFEGYIEGEYAEHGIYELQGAANIPLGEVSAIRFSGFWAGTDGFIENDIGPDQGQHNSFATRVQYTTDLLVDLSLKLRGEYSEDSSNAAGGAFARGGEPRSDGLSVFRDAPFNTDSGYIDADGSVFTGSYNDDGFFERAETNLSVEVVYDIGNWSIKSISAYNDITLDYGEDNDASPFDIAEFFQKTEQSSYSQEFRISADFDRSNITAGFYYLDISGDYSQSFQLNNLGNFNGVIAPIPVLLLPLGQKDTGNYSIDTKSWSLYGQAEYEVTDKVKITAGLRYTRDKKDYAYQQTCESLIGSPLACAPLPSIVIGGAGLVKDSHHEAGISARLQLDYHLNEDTLIYVSYNRGYKAFNYNAGFSGAAQVDSVRFDGETINAYEIGSKLEFLDGIARLNLAGFYYDYKDYQAFDQRGVSFVLSNTDAEIYGAEGELSLSPGGGFEGRVGFVLLNTNVADIDIGGVLLDRDIPQSADVEFNFGLSQSIELGTGVVKLNFDGSYIGEYFSQLTNSDVTRVGGYWNFNSLISYRPDGEAFELSLFARNIFNTEQLIYAFDITFPGSGLVRQNYANPRTFGAGIRFNF